MDFHIRFSFDAPRGAGARLARFFGPPVLLVMTAAGVAYAYSTSWIKDGQPLSAQSLKATLDEGLVPAGTLLPFAGSACPSGYVAANGASVLRSGGTECGGGSCGALFAAISTAWGTADSSHFTLPDLRGRFARGVDTGAGRDPDRASRTSNAAGGYSGDSVGSLQLQATKRNGLGLTDPGHTHDTNFGVHTVQGGAGTGVIDNAGATDTSRANGATLSTTGITLGNGDSETRPVNANVNYCVKF